jgi:glycosyltransferase involved in cell wall biosynthesis
VLLARRGDASRWQALAPGAEVHAIVPRPRPLRLAWEQVEGPRAAARLGIDVWHGPHYTLPLRADVRTVVTVHDLTLLEHPEWHERAKVVYFRRMIPAAVARADVCVCVSRHTALRLATVATPAGDVVVVHHGVDTHRFSPEGDVASDLEALAPLGVAPPYVAFVGTLEPRKNVPMLVDAFARVARGRPDLRLVLAGGAGWGAREIDRAVVANGIGPRVVRTGYVDDAVVPALLRRAEAVAYPSFEEGFGNPALEALACGAPLVTTRGSSVEELVADDAVLCEPGNPDALATGLVQALDPTVAAGLRARAPRRAARFTWRACAEAHVEAYERALARAA